MDKKDKIIPVKKLSEEALRALNEAGRDGPEPVRFGDWEKKGIAIDF